MGNEIKNVEIFATGKHNGDVYTDKDLDILVKSANEIDFKPAIKLGHKQESGAPAYGYLNNIRKEGSKILADMIKLPDEIYKAIKDGGYSKVSVEIYENLNRSGKTFKKAIGAIALLGQELAGVAGLKPITEFNCDDFERLNNYDFDIIENKAYINNDGENGAGSGNNEGVDIMSDTKLKEYQDQIDGLKTQIQALVDNAATTSDTAKEYETKFNNAQKALDNVNEKLLAKESEEKSKQVVIPALQGQFAALYSHALENSETTVKVYSSESKKDEEKNMVDVLDSMVSYINEKAGAIFKEYAQANTDRSEGYDDPIAEADSRIKKYMAENKTDDYSLAQKAVFDADPELKSAYAAI